LVFYGKFIWIYDIGDYEVFIVYLDSDKEIPQVDVVINEYNG